MATSVDSFQVKVYQGDSAVLFAFDVADADRADLAGFAIQCTPQGGAPYWVPNRLTFDTPIHADAPLQAGKYADSIDAPFQSFHWVHFPPHAAGQYTYTANSTDDSAPFTRSAASESSASVWCGEKPKRARSAPPCGTACQLAASASARKAVATLRLPVASSPYWPIKPQMCLTQ